MIETKEDRENQKLQEKADRFNTGWMAHFEATQAKYSDRQTYKVYLLKKELQKHGLEDDGNAEALVARLAEHGDPSAPTDGVLGIRCSWYPLDG